MPASLSPSDRPAIVIFAKEQEAWRQAAGLSKKQLAEALGYTDSYVGQIELLKNKPSEEYAQNLDTFFKTNGTFHRHWQQIEETRHLASLPPGFTEYLEYEVKATELRACDANLVNGLLQTENYARTILQTNQVPGNVDRMLQDRMERQKIFTRNDPPYAWFLMDEAVLRRIIGGPEIMREQLAHILEFSERPTNQVSIIPHGLGFHEGLMGYFVVLGFEDGSQVTYAESANEGLLLTDRVRVARHVVRYDLIRGYALPVEESRALIRAVMEEL